jgi:hypothetical protein
VINIKNAEENYQAFICYETTTALSFARNLKTGLEKLNCNAFVAADDIPPGSDQQNYRYSVIQKAPKFILIMTFLGLTSEEVKNETNEALKHNKDLIPCIHANVKPDDFKSVFPEAGKKQWIRFKDESDLANQVTSSIRNNSLMQKKINLDGQNCIQVYLKNNLVIEPEWSLKKISNDNNIGHIIFKLKNLSDKRIFIYGYKMLRVSPNGLKDVYYNTRICDEKDFNKWVSDLHLNIILYKNDEHIFHWDDVSIMDVYGINKIGKWLAEVRVAYIEEGSDDLLYSIGTAEIEFEQSKSF